MTKHVKFQFDQAEIKTDPFPQISIDDIFPNDLYEKIIENSIPNECLQTLNELGRVPTNYYQDRKLLSLTPRMLILSDNLRKFWEPMTIWLLTDFKKLVVEKFSPFIYERFKNDIPKIDAETLYTRDFKGYRLGPHTDSLTKIITLLVYLPKDSSNSHLGTSIYQPLDPNFRCKGGPHYKSDTFKQVYLSPYVPNRLFGFFKTDNSFHGVEPITVDVERNLLIYDLYCKKL